MMQQQVREEFTFTEEDNLIVKYYEDRVKVVLIRYLRHKDIMELVLLCKIYDQKLMRVEMRFSWPAEEGYIEGATYVCSH